jgi:hypothetical protein
MGAVTKVILFMIVLAASFGAGAALGAALPDLGPDQQPAPAAPAGHP